MNRAETSQELPAIGLLVIECGGERYGIPSAAVQEILRLRQWTVVPGAPHTLPGIISQRGQILPVVEMRALLGFPEVELQRSARFVLVQHQEIEMALLVERVLDLMSFEASVFGQQTGAFDNRRGRFVSGIANVEDQPLALLDLDALMAALREGN